MGLPIGKKIRRLPQPEPRCTFYPWTEWMNGSIWEIKRGVDYRVRSESMKSNLHMRAGRHKRKVKVVLADEITIAFQFMR